MQNSVGLIEINVYDKMVPLVSGYLQAYASAQPALKDAYRFDKYTVSRNISIERLLCELDDLDSDIYAFSCYLWNAALVKRVLPKLRIMKPDARILLGGPQVMHHGELFLDPTCERVHVCNGEGEKTFASYLTALLDKQPDLSKVPGLSYYKNGTLQTTDLPGRFRSLDEIPSPFLTGLFDGEYQTTIFETNRGCPFHCGFCFWGAATNDKVAKFEEERLRAEIEWASQHNIPYIFLADANWGMLRRDIELSKFMTECKAQYGNPIYIYFSAAKNSPKKVAQITELFTREGMFNIQPISMQSLDKVTLEKIERSNIKLKAYEDLQSDLNDKNISSFIELIWPLPGETIDTFRHGVETLIAGGARNIIVYPHLLLHNTPLYKRQEEYGLVTRTIHDGVSEAQIVVETTTASREDVNRGFWFIYAVLAIHNTDTVTQLKNYLHTSGISTHQELLAAFANWCRTHRDNAISRFCEASIANADYYDVLNYPQVYYLTMHAARQEFDELLYKFASAQPWWEDVTAQALFEFGILTRAHLYNNSPVQKPSWPLRHLTVLAAANRTYQVRVPFDQQAVLVEHFGDCGVRSNVSGDLTFLIDHKKGQFPHMENQTTQQRCDYCSGVITRIRNYRPVWSQPGRFDREFTNDDKATTEQSSGLKAGT